MKCSRLVFVICIAVVLSTVLAPAGLQLAWQDGLRVGFETKDVRAAASSVTNDLVGDLAVFSQDYSASGAVPGNVCLALEVGSGCTENVTLRYDDISRCVSLDGIEGALGRLFVGGLSPSLSTTLTLDMGMRRTEDHATVNVFAGGAWLAIRLLDSTPTDALQITSYYYNPALHYANSVTADTGFSGGGRFTIEIVSNSVSRVNTIYLNGVEKLTTPFTSYRAHDMITAYDPFVNPFMFFSFDSIYSGQTACLQLYSIEQTVPQYSYITPVSNPRLTSFGVDGPHAWDTVDTGLSLLEHGTVWADPTYIDDYSPSELAALKALIAGGWELGIHFSQRLSDLPLADAITLMNTETAQVTAIFGEPPVSFCSLQGADNTTHAEYAYSNLGMVSRTGENGGGCGLTNIGNLGDNYWHFWSTVSAAGIVIPCFSHELDITPAIEYSISPANFSSWLSNYASNGVQIVGFREYWEIAQNSYHTTISNVVSDPGVSLSFTVANMGGRSRLLVNAPWASAVLDSSGSSIPYQVCGSGIVIEVGSGDYTVAAAPQADFSADNTVVVVGQSIRFTDVSTGALMPLSYEWDFGDGKGSALQNPSHSYSSEGTFTPVLRVTDPAASTDIKVKANYITVAQPLSVTTGLPTALTASSATLNGDLAALGTAASVSVCFEWGTTAAYGSETPAQSMSAAGAFTANLTGLSDNSAYHFRARAAGDAGTVYGDDLTFTTTRLAHTTAPAISSPSVEVTSSGATIRWTTDEAATSQVEYGLTEEYGATTAQDPSLIINHSVELSDLDDGETYHYRVISTDVANNEAVSADATFTTTAGPSGGTPAWVWVLIGLAAVSGAGTAVFLTGRKIARH